MAERQGRAVLREGLRKGDTATVYRVVSKQNYGETETVAVIDRIRHDRSSVKPIKSSKFPTVMERANRIAHDISRNVVNQIESLTQAGKMDSDGLREILLQSLSDLKRADVSASAAKHPSKPLPETAPEKWQMLKKNKNKLGETPTDFIQRVYKDWLGHGLTRSTIFQLDKPLYASLNNYLRSHKMPDDMDLPTIKQVNDRRIEALRSKFVASDGAEHFEEAGRLATALKGREQRSRSRE